MIRDRSKKKTKPLMIVLMVIFAGIFLYSGYQLFSIWWGYHEGARVQAEVRDVFYNEGSSILDKINSGEGNYRYMGQTEFDDTDRLIDSADDALELLAPLEAQNPDTIGWITIPDSIMDFVVLQGASNNTYLWKNFYHQDNSCGSIFLDSDNVLGAPLQNYIIYGHHMRDGSMFHDLNFYKDQNWVAEHPSFTLILENGIYDCYVYSVILTTVYEDLWRTSFTTAQEKQEYINFCQSLALYGIASDVSSDDEIVTLSTCEYTKGDQIGRMLICAKMVKRWYTTDEE